MRTIGVVTTSRADYGAFLPVLRAIVADADLRLRLFVSGTHLSPEFGMTVHDIERDGFEIAERVEVLLSSDSPEGIAKSTGIAMLAFAQVYARARPDILLVLGDRFEMHAAVVAALPFKVPVAHISGGEVTQGAIDDSLRHAITKMSHLHFVATEDYARRVRQLGEESWRIAVSGAPTLDNLRTVPLLSREELAKQRGVRVGDGSLLVTYHPVTLEYENTERQVEELLAALDASKRPVLFTMPNADTYGRTIRQMIFRFVEGHPTSQAVENLGVQGYFSAMSLAVAMVGNSSSGIVEAASFKLPVVNIGNRQQGRVASANVIHVGYERSEIGRGIAQATSAEFHAGLRDLSNPYGDGRAANRIVDRLRTVSLDQHFVSKRFVDFRPSDITRD